MDRRMLGSRPLQSWRWGAVGLVAICGAGFWGGNARAGGGEDFSVAPAAVTGSAPTLILRRDAPQEDGGAASEPSLPEGYEALSNSSAGLVEQPGMTEAGGVMVGLRGRFRTALVLERKADGSRTTRCISNLPGEAAGDH